MRRTLWIVALPAFLTFLPVGSPATLASETPTVSVDYVMGMLQAGMNQQAIVKSILDRGVTFTLGPGDLGRLRAAGAGDLLVQTVMRQGGVLEDTPPAEGEEGAAGPAETAPGSTPHPRRMVQGEVNSPPQPRAEDTCDIYYCPGDYAYSYYYPGYSPYYYPGFYAGFYYPYSYPYGYYNYGYSNYYGNGYYDSHHPGRVSPRGTPHGQSGGTAPGGHGSPRGSPRGGSQSAPSGHGSSSHSSPRAPRGGHN
jgi:hypothetical protein